jgi:hypothetical protein
MAHAERVTNAQDARPPARGRAALAGTAVGLLLSLPGLFLAVLFTGFGDEAIDALQVPFVAVSTAAIVAAWFAGWLILRGASGAARPVVVAAWSFGISLLACAVITTVMVLTAALVVTLTITFLWSSDYLRPAVWTAAIIALVGTLAVSVPTTIALVRWLDRRSRRLTADPGASSPTRPEPADAPTPAIRI